MNIRIEEDENCSLEPEIIIRCREIDERVHKLMSILDSRKKKLLGYAEQKEYIIDPGEVLYCESVDGTVFIYGKEQVYRTAYTLNEVDNFYSEEGFFRCSKSMVININSIKMLRSELGNRIDALLSNGEHIMISRRYAKQLRAILKEVGNV